MSELLIIETALEKASGRRRWQNAWRGFWRGMLAGGVLWLVALAVYKVFPVPISSLLVAALAAAVCAGAGFLHGFWRKPTLSETARWLDRKQDLKERLSTALEVAGHPTPGNWQQLIVHDAACQVEKLDARRLLPFHLPAASRWALLVLALGAGLGFVPEYRSKDFLQREKDAANIKDTGKQLVDLTKRTLQQRPPALETTQKAMETVNELGDQMQKKNPTRAEALKDLASVADKIKDQMKELGKDPALKRMQQAARTPTGDMPVSPSAVQKKIEDLEKALGSKAADAGKMEQLKKDLQKLKDAAAGMPDNNSPGGEQAREQMAQSLSNLAKQAKDMGMNLAGLEEAIAALNEGKPGLAIKDLQTALQDLEKMRDLAKSMQQLKQQAAKLGKDLGEQLDKGQADAAQATLKKMIEQLKSGETTPEQLQKMLQEVSQAVKPAGDYGKVAEHLKAAAKQLQQGQKPDASQSLADASKELQKLLDQMADAQSLQAELASLSRAQMAVATGQGMGQCKAPGVGPGGKPGQGVGTWAEEMEGWLQAPEITDLWDNSGAERPDQDPRGHTDRGEGQVADNLTPTKVKGQFAPGGQMPSITLKGVSIKGTSNVQYEQAATAAQTEAQSALSQEKVPRAYQGAVRDYFDDLKK